MTMVKEKKSLSWFKDVIWQKNYILNSIIYDFILNNAGVTEKTKINIKQRRHTKIISTKILSLIQKILYYIYIYISVKCVSCRMKVFFLQKCGLPIDLLTDKVIQREAPLLKIWG